MRSSRGEIKIEDILNENDFTFEEEYIFSDLTASSHRPLRFDFAVFDDAGNIDFLIEYQGCQHYKPSSLFGGKSGLYKQQYNDNQKRIYCQKNRLTLVSIPYWDEDRITYDYIMKAAGY